MERRDYSNFLSHILYDIKLRSILMIDIYDTRCDLNTEYHTLFAKGNSKLYYLFHDFSLSEELEFYLKLDMITYLPFEKLGYDYLNKKLENSNVNDFKYNKLIKIFNDAEFNIDDKLKDDIKYFLNNYYNDVVEINIIGLSIILLRLFHRYVMMMNFNIFKGGTLGIHKKIGVILDKIVNEVNSKGLKEININDYLVEFDYSNELNEDMIKYLEYCLDKES